MFRRVAGFGTRASRGGTSSLPQGQIAVHDAPPEQTVAVAMEVDLRVMGVFPPGLSVSVAGTTRRPRRSGSVIVPLLARASVNYSCGDARGTDARNQGVVGVPRLGGTLAVSCVIQGLARLGPMTVVDGRSTCTRPDDCEPVCGCHPTRCVARRMQNCPGTLECNGPRTEERDDSLYDCVCHHGRCAARFVERHVSGQAPD